MASPEALRIVTDLDPETALKLWFVGIGITAPIKDLVGGRPALYADGPGMIIYVAETSKRARDYMAQQFGLPANLEIQFELDACRDRSSPQTTIIQGTLEFMRRTGADGGLWFDGNKTIVLMRQGGDLMINDDPALWTPARLKLLENEVYSRQTLVQPA